MSVSEKKVVVVGGSRGLGRAIVATAHSAGARVLAAGRERDSLARLSDELPGVMTLLIDATDENSPTRLFDLLQPDVLVICAGALPHMAPLHDQSWEEFSRNWDSDVRISFLFCRAALVLPLSSGTTIILISSGAAIGGSPLSGSYAGAKRMQMFLAKYCQKEADRLNLGLRFLALAPMRPMPDTRLGQIAVEGYAKYQGITSSDFLKRMGTRQTPEDVANGLSDLRLKPTRREEMSSESPRRESNRYRESRASRRLERGDRQHLPPVPILSSGQDPALAPGLFHSAKLLRVRIT